MKGDAEAAVPAYKRAIELAPNRWQLRQQLAWILYELERFAQAEAVLHEVIRWRQGKDVSTAEQLLAQVRKKQAKREQERPDQAKREQDTELGGEGPGPNTSACLEAIRLHSVHNPEKALEVAERGLLSKPRSVPLLLARARAQVGLGKLSDAVASYGEALAIDPDNEEATRGLIETQTARRTQRLKRD